MATKKSEKTESEKSTTIPKRLQGIVVSTKQEKTIVVRVEIKFAHPLYKKIVKSHKRYNVHCEDESVKVGDEVLMEEGKPVSRNKSFYFTQKVERK
ncbi:MAG: 30S ribosomal protein S17 [Candidatus Dojkabacteria bacterium]